MSLAVDKYERSLHMNEISSPKTNWSAYPRERRIHHVDDTRIMITMVTYRATTFSESPTHVPGGKRPRQGCPRARGDRSVATTFRAGARRAKSETPLDLCEE